jgi:hypothetical protein
LGAGYLLRERGPFSPSITLFLGVLPNLAGCLAVPLIVAPILRRRLNGIWSTRRMSALLGAVIGFAGAAAIEAFHVILNLGAYDPNDMVASLVGTVIGVAILFSIDRIVPADRGLSAVVRGEA